jgi:hypothetical protein
MKYSMMAVAEKPALGSGREDTEGEPGDRAVRYFVLPFLRLERADTTVGQVVRAAPHSGLPTGWVPPRAHAKKRTTEGPLEHALVCDGMMPYDTGDAAKCPWIQ